MLVSWVYRKLFDSSLVDDIVEIEFRTASPRAGAVQSEGLLAGPSSGLIYEGARESFCARKWLGVMIFPTTYANTPRTDETHPGLATGQ